MTQHEHRKDEAIEHIAKTLVLLDLELERLRDNHESGKKNSAKSWFEQKKAIYEIKRALSCIGEYDNYQEEESDYIIQSYLAKMSVSR